ncbi:hypothetical protein BDV93DRAFT_606071 [Ceratobasidium sp. AG-I]|nr:hypothetical protein BDV93DRAFT_606071 [Ceratobasidium sp. AG-I]
MVPRQYGKFTIALAFRNADEWYQVVVFLTGLQLFVLRCVVSYYLNRACVAVVWVRVYTTLNLVIVPTISVHQVLSNSELLGLILASADTSTCARLVSTSDNFFKQGIIHIWKDLPTAKPLILLIPGAREVELKKKEYTIRLPPPPADFSRFDVYAPLVHSLTTFGPGRSGYQTSFNIDPSWQTLVFRARGSPLLPNLKTFTLDHTFNKDEEPVLWVSAFLTQSLRVFKAERLWCGGSYVTSSTMPVILRRIACDCSNLESLSLYVGPPGDAQDNPSLFRVILEEPPSWAWRNFQKLTSLVTDVNTLNADSLMSLGQLPHLHTLEIQTLGDNQLRSPMERLPSSVPNTALSENSFSCLRYLTIDSLHYDDIMTLWDQELLVNELSSLQLYAPPSRDEANTAAQLSTGFLPVLCARSPRLITLEIQFKPSFLDTDSVPLDI